MSALGVAGGVLQAVVIVGGAPLLLGLMRQVRARLEGRAGPGVGQPWRDLRKLVRKQSISPRGTTEVFRVAPVLLVAMTLVVAVVAPLVTTASAVPPVADLFVVVALLAHATVVIALAGLDSGTAFGGMGASRR
ncbi:NADH-quinone oxidoreductase subunit H [Pseudonocardia benzenivorans]